MDEIAKEHREYLWGLCYRMTGDAAESEDLVQETFRRLVERPPADTTSPLRPWLTTVATRLAIDALRRRKRRGYPGSWLPSAVLSETSPDPAERSIEAIDPEDAEHRFELAESTSLAFLVALEALDARQRAALVLRDVFGYSGPEVANLLETSPENVRVILHRARKALAPYAERRCVPSPELVVRTRQACARLFGALVRGDADAVLACLHDEAISVSDSGGRYKSATKDVRGAARVARLLLGLRKRNTAASVREVFVNGVPGLRIDLADPAPRVAPVVVIQVDVDQDDRITVVRLLLNPDKIS